VVVSWPSFRHELGQGEASAEGMRGGTSPDRHPFAVGGEGFFGIEIGDDPKGVKVCMNPGRRREICARAQRIIAEEVVNHFIQDPHRIIAARVGIGCQAVYFFMLDLTEVTM